MVPPTRAPNETSSFLALKDRFVSDGLWRTVLEADRSSDEFPRLATEILEAQRQSALDVSQFTKDQVAQLIELIDTTVLRHENIPSHLKSTAFGILRRLCGAFQQLPNSCLIGEELKISDNMPFAKRTYADLWKGNWKGEDVAVKLLRFAVDDDRAKITKRFCKEMVLWKQLRHKNLLPFYGACMDNQFGMVSPWLRNGDIVHFTRKNTEVNRLHLLTDVANGLEYLHRASVIHGNLRGSNILISYHDWPRALLSDYGLTSIIFDPFSLTRESINWTAPELLSVDGKCGPSFTSDIYALAMVIYEVLTGAPPFVNRQKPELACQVVLEDERPPRPNNWEALGITNEIWDLLVLCWAKDASSRPAVSDVVRCLKGAEKHWTADPTAFLLASEAGVQEVISMKPEKAQKIADDLDKALDRIGVSRSTRKYLRCLQKLCGVSGVLPQSFALTEELEGVEKYPFGGGGFSDVYKATYKGQTVAVKVLRIDALGDPNLTRMSLAKEVVGWKWLRHDNVLPLLGVTWMPSPLRMVSPWMENGNIIYFLKNHPEQNPFDLLVDVTKGLQYLHDHDFVHGDLKGANILVDSKQRARLADFGLARIIEDSCSRDTQSSQRVGTVRWSAPEYLRPEMFGFGKKSRRRLPSKSTDIYALGMTIFEVIAQRHPFDHLRTEAVYMHVIEGGRPERPAVGFSDVLWGLLEQSWYCEHESMRPRRPPISLLRAQLEQDSGAWVSVIGMSGAATPDADDSTPLSLDSDVDPDLRELLKQVEELLGIKRPATAPVPIVAPAPTTDPAPIVVPSPVPIRQASVYQVPSQGSRKGGGAGGHARRTSFQKIQDKFRLLRAKFSRANRGPVTLSEGLVPEREENAEVVEKRYAKLFG